MREVRHEPEDAAQAAAALQIRAISPHMKLVELFRRGYLLLDIDRSPDAAAPPTGAVPLHGAGFCIAP